VKKEEDSKRKKKAGKRTPTPLTAHCPLILTVHCFFHAVMCVCSTHSLMSLSSKLEPSPHPLSFSFALSRLARWKLKDKFEGEKSGQGGISMRWDGMRRSTCRQEEEGMIDRSKA